MAADETRRETHYQRQTFDAERSRPEHWLVMRPIISRFAAVPWVVSKEST